MSLKRILSYIRIVAVFMLTTKVHGQEKERNLLQTFSSETVSQALIPRDQWKPFPQSPAEWKEKIPEDLIIDIIKKGEESNEKSFPSIPATTTLEFIRNGTRLNYENILFPKRKQLWTLVLAESVEGKGRFVDSIINGIWSISEESSWGTSAHLYLQDGSRELPDVENPSVDLFSAETATILSWTDYFIGPSLDQISPLIRKRIQYEVNRRIFIPLAAKNYDYLIRDKPNNWNPWVMSNYLTAVLLLQKDEKLRAEAVYRSIKHVDHYLNDLGSEASCDEGPAYWYGSAGCVFDFLNLLDSGTNGKVELYDNPFIQHMGSYFYKVHIDDDYFVNIGDSPPRTKLDGVLLYRFGKKTNDEAMKAFGSWALQNQLKKTSPFNAALNFQFQKSRDLFNLLAFQNCRDSTGKKPDIESSWMADIQVMTARTRNGLFLSSHAGHNGVSHNHNDVGDFILYADGKPIIIDVGKGEYTARTFRGDRYKLWFNTSPYHNLPNINGCEEKSGRAFKATDVGYENSENSSLLHMDIAHAFQPEAGVKKWKRSVTVIKDGSIEIVDQYEMEQEMKSLTQTFMTCCDVNINEPGKVVLTSPEGTRICLAYSSEAWTPSVEKIESTIPEDQPFKTIWNNQIKRVLLTNKDKKSKGEAHYAFTRL